MYSGILRKLGSAFHFEGRAVGRTPDPVMNPECTEFEVNNWTISEFVVTTLVPIVGVHPFPLNELCLMVSAICRLKPSHVFEWGTHIGKSARIFYESSRYFGLETEIHSIDLPDNVLHSEHPKHRRGQYVKAVDYVKLYQGDGLLKALELYRSINPHRSLFFLDGDHEYETVHSELLSISRETKNADILVHDTFYQSIGSGYNIGPYRAIADLLREMPDRYTSIATSTGLPGMTLLYRL